MNLKEEIIKTANQKILFTRHSLDQMNKPDRLISEEEVEFTVLNGEIIEDYQEDARGRSCLVSAFTKLGRAIHVVCSPKKDYLAVVTAYIPDPKEWDATLKKRRR